MKVYRLECADGKGPYCTDDMQIARFASEKFSTISHTVVWDDCRGFDSRYKCAFIHRKALRRWFQGGIEKFLKMGVDLVEYEVPSQYVLLGIKQVAYRADKATERRVIRRGKKAKKERGAYEAFYY